MKKLNKVLSIVLAMAMVLALTAITAFAQDASKQNTAAAITKVLKLPKDFTLPEDFETQFTFHLDTIDNVDPATTGDTSGVIGTNGVVTITKDSTNYKVAGTTEAPTDTYYFTTGDVLSGVNFHGGTYKYTVTETKYLIDGVEASSDTKKLDKASNTYVLTVQTDSEGKVTNATIRENGDKKPFNPGSEEKDVKDNGENGFSFTNKYYTVNGKDDEKTDPSKDDAVLSVEKNVEGGGDTTTGFAIKVTLIAPEGTGADLTGVTAYTRASSTADAVEATGTNGVYEVKLAHGNKLFFKGVPEGTTYKVEETDDRASATDTTAAYLKSGEITAATLNKSAGKQTITNKYQTKTDEGILISNLPYIVLALVAVGGLVAYVVVRRKADEA